MSRRTRIAATLVLTGLAVAYLVWKVDLRKTIDTLLDANPWWFALSVAIMIGTALPMALRWQWMMRAQGMEDTFALADARVPRLVHGESGAADVDRRRRDARLRDRAAPPGQNRRRDGDHPPRARPRRRGHRPARRDRVPAGARHLRRRRVPVARGGVRLRDDRAHLPLLRPFRSPAPGPDAAASAPVASRPSPSRVLRRGAPLPEPRTAARRRLRLHDGDPGGARPVDLGGRRSPSGSSSGRGSTT